MEFENYHCHTCYSNALTQPDSTQFISDYAEVYKERGHHVLCMSEHGNRSNVWEQFDIAEAYRNNKNDPYDLTPLAASEVYFVPDRFPDSEGKFDGRNFHLILVARDMEGFYQLNEILSEANLTGFYKHARVDFDLLGRLDYRHFLCTTACVAGLTRDENYEQLACQLHEIFKDSFYLEIQHHNHEKQIETNTKILRLYGKYRWPLIYGTDSHYINKEDKELRKELLLSARITYGDEDDFLLYLPTADEAYQMLQQQGVFANARIQEAMENTLILREFEGVHFTKEKKIPNAYPEISLEKRNYLYKKTVCGEYIRKAGQPGAEEAAELHSEMDTITSTGTADYFLIMKRIVDKGKEYGGVLTTTGRGSGASFATNYAMGFTSINRLKCPVKMYPERFISADRLANGLPDLDLNMANVPAFETAAKEILGEWGCLPMIAFGTVKTLSAFKLLARARDLDFDTSNTISKQLQNYEMDVKHAKENNADDPDYDVDDDVQIDSYVEDQYLDLVEESKQYRGIITSISPHPCAHLLLDRDIRREIGVIRVKSKSGNKDAVYAAYIDGRTADSYNYLKADFLRVDVVKIIAETFNLIGKPVMTVDELNEAIKDDKEVWDLYKNGITMGLNQVEREKSSQRCMQYQPRSLPELAAFVAAIRPGFKSMLNRFINREHFEYNIPSLDNLLKTKEIPESFLMYDEQILQILKAAGIPGPDAYACTKAIKKKKAEKVASFKERFKDGFSRMLQEKEHATPEKADETVEEIWTIINDAAQYMFCSAHSTSMGYDSLYCAWLKVHYPYELYVTMLKLYDEKKNTDKISAIIAEMKRYRNIRLLSGKWGQDNRDWLVNKEEGTISQSISSIRFMSKQAAEDLYQLSQQEESEMGVEYIQPKLNKEGKKLEKKLKQIMENATLISDRMTDDEIKNFNETYEQLHSELWNSEEYLAVKAAEIHHFAKLDCFTNVLRALQMNTCLDTRQIKILIELGYFAQFGGSAKLMVLCNRYFEGEKKLSKTLKSFNERLEMFRQMEKELPDGELPIQIRLQSENENIGLCMSTDEKADNRTYFVKGVDEKWGTTVTLYSVSSGKSGTVRFRKDDLKKKPVAQNQMIRILDGNSSPRYTYKGGQRTPIPGEREYWVKSYSILQPA